MTTIPADHLWNAMPGWGIVADLTPPELVNQRHLRRLRRLIAAALIALLALCIGGYVLAARQRAGAARGLDGVQGRTVQLQGSSHKYAGITKIEGTVTQVQAQVATLMAADVDVSALLVRLRAELPTTMTIRQESVMISLAGVASGGTASGTGLDTSGHARIGNVAVSGAGRTLDDLSAYVDRLKVIPGVVDVVPVSNVSDQAGMQYSLTLGLSDVLLSHRFDVSKKGGR
ncbi:MAG TPA: hypothetical protein VGL39_13415 [Jatrophihabitantaceae bacterium]|jgi:hypothetical protein